MNWIEAQPPLPLPISAVTSTFLVLLNVDPLTALFQFSVLFLLNVYLNCHSQVLRAKKLQSFCVFEQNPDGSQFVLDVLRDLLCNFLDSHVSLRMAFEEAREHGCVLSQSDPQGFGTVGGRVQDPEPVCVDQRGSVFHRAGSYIHFWGWHCCVLCLLEHWFVSDSMPSNCFIKCLNEFFFCLIWLYLLQKLFLVFGFCVLGFAAIIRVLGLFFCSFCLCLFV